MKRDKVAILTHPLISNYGGVLQAFALSTYLNQLGFESIVLDRRNDRSFIKRLVIDCLTHIPFTIYFNNFHKTEYVRKFIKKQIKRTQPIYSNEKLLEFCKDNDLSAVIVGSDQVWRADFAMRFHYNYFLDFLLDNMSVKRIAYAASFGMANWDYSDSQTKQIKKLLKNFVGISVREESGQYLCSNYLNIEAEHVVDPTFLIERKVYDEVASSRLEKENYIFVYWLGSELEKNAILDSYRHKMKIVDISLRSQQKLISIEDWLSYIKYASLIITDSFHGCVFSLIFEKEFIICNNKSGGYSRISSLFKMLGIEQKLKDSDYKIDYVNLKKTLSQHVEKSKLFLSNCLNAL